MKALIVLRLENIFPSALDSRSKLACPTWGRKLMMEVLLSSTQRNTKKISLPTLSLITKCNPLSTRKQRNACLPNSVNLTNVLF